jgi:hypothetical protein
MLQMRRYLFTTILILFLTGSNLPISAQAPDDSIFYFQSFDDKYDWAIQEPSAQTVEFLHEFDGPTLNREASIYIPKPRFTLNANPGHLRLIFPGTAFFDHWLGNDAAPAIHVQAPDGNWIMTTRAKLVQPEQGGFFHTGLMVRFSQFNVFYWGIYQTDQLTELRLERTGVKNLLSVSLSSAEDLSR